MGKTGRIAPSGKMAGGGILRLKRMAVQVAAALGISGVVAILFYNSIWGMAVFPLVYLLIAGMIKEKVRKRRRKQLNLEFKDYMYAVSGTLSAGYSVERAFLAGLEEIKGLYGKDCSLAEHLAGMEKRIGLQEPIERILRDFAVESDSEDIENFVEIFCYAKRGGGDFVHIMTTTIGRICDKMEVLGEIHTVMSEKALEQKIMCIVPIGILFFFRLTSPQFITGLYGNLPGIVIMTVALIVYGIAFFLGVKIVEVEV